MLKVNVMKMPKTSWILPYAHAASLTNRCYIYIFLMKIKCDQMWKKCEKFEKMGGDVNLSWMGCTLNGRQIFSQKKKRNILNICSRVLHFPTIFHLIPRSTFTFSYACLRSPTVSYIFWRFSTIFDTFSRFPYVLYFSPFRENNWIFSKVKECRIGLNINMKLCEIMRGSILVKYEEMWTYEPRSWSNG